MTLFWLLKDLQWGLRESGNLISVGKPQVLGGDECSFSSSTASQREGLAGSAPWWLQMLIATH